ncbi:MAG: nucleotidyltransferase domain-containing protein [Caldilineaceae bacterium]|nr:nucleotidyltransferase domain-containing protein [Caldilineaceae bacterium]
MAVDLTNLTQVVTAALLRDLGDEVDLIIRYGSQVRGNTHAYSDLDLSYVPVHESTGQSITVLVGETLCDLYPIRWSALESMSRFENISSTVLLNCQIVYQRTEESALRLRGLADKLRALLHPTARPTMLKKAQEYFQRTGHAYFLLQQAAEQGHSLAALHHAQQILNAVAHTLALCNQSCVDTRKLAELLALPRLPADFSQTVQAITAAYEPHQLHSACARLLSTTRDLLLSEQRQVQNTPTDYAAAFGPGYPELKGDVLHILLACERRDPFGVRGPLVSLYHELSVAIARAETGLEVSPFNSLADYEADFIALGFPALLPSMEARNFEGLHAQVLAFDRHMQHFLAEHGVPLYAFATIEDLQRELEVRNEGIDHVNR